MLNAGAAGGAMRDNADDLKLRREALQIAIQLPENESDALAVLKYAEELVRGFLAGRPSDPKPPLRLV